MVRNDGFTHKIPGKYRDFTNELWFLGVSENCGLASTWSLKKKENDAILMPSTWNDDPG